MNKKGQTLQQYIKQCVFSKKMLYTVCFMALNFIDMLRNTQNGDVWSVAVNVTGLVVMVIVSSAYSLKEFLNVQNYIWTGICFAAMAVLLFTGENRINGIYIWTVETAIVNVWWIGIFVRHIFHRIFAEKSIAFRPGVMGWLGIAMVILMTASVSGRLWPLWFLLMFGIFYLTKYKLLEMQMLLEGMINGTIISFFCLQIYAYGFRPYDIVRYTGAFSNSNVTALHYLVVYAMVLLKLHILQTQNAGKGRKIFFFIGAAGLLGFQFLTLSRTAWITSVILTVLYGIFVMKSIWLINWKGIVIRGMALVLAVILVFPAVFGTVRWLPTILHHPIWYEGEYSVLKVHSFDPADSDKYIELNEVFDAVFQKLITAYNSAQNSNPFVLQAHAAEMETVEKYTGLDNILSGRLSIYKTYFKDLTWYGHTRQEGYYQIGTGPFQTWHAQNLWLQIAYYYGIPAGIVLIILSAVMVYSNFKFLKKGKNNVYAIIPFFFTILFFCYGSMELVWETGQFIFFLIFFIQHPQIGGEMQDEDKLCG